MNTALISLASNTPDKQAQMRTAFEELHEMGIIAETSSIYETAPYGNPRQKNYLNAVAQVSTSIGYNELHEILKKQEQAHGRTPESKQTGEIPLDIDIVVWNGEILRPQDYTRDYFKIGLEELRTIPTP